MFLLQHPSSSRCVTSQSRGKTSSPPKSWEEAFQRAAEKVQSEQRHRVETEFEDHLEQSAAGNFTSVTSLLLMIVLITCYSSCYSVYLYFVTGLYASRFHLYKIE